MIELVTAEWLKLRTTRPLHGTVPAAVALSAAAVAGTVLSHDGGAPLASSEGIRRALSVTGTGAIVGVVISAGEYRHRTAADTFLATPQRRQVVAAKLAVGAGLGLMVGAVTSLTSVGVAALVYDVEGATFPFGDAEVWLTLGGTLAYTTLFAVLGVALGALVSNQLVAVAGALAWLAVVEHTLVNLLPDLGRWLPAAAGQAIVRTPLDGLLPPLAGAVLLTAYTSLFAVAGIRATATRDV